MVDKTDYPKVWDRRLEKLVPASEFYQQQSRFGNGPMVIRDIEPYRSIVTGEIVSGRRQHRDHLRAHELAEVGNEKLPPRQKTIPDPRPDIIQVMKEKGKIG